MHAEEWLERLGSVLPEATVAVGDEERDLLLDLARVAAHSSERWTAPVSTYLAGLALAGLDEQQRVERLRSVMAAVEGGG